MRKNILRAVIAVVVLLVVVGLIGSWWFNGKLRGSLAILEGNRTLPGLTEPVVIERDAQGVATIRAANRNDLARATGFLHGQERFFQMDLLRRNSAGELAELVGKPVLEHDRDIRRHRFRNVAQRVSEVATAEDKALIESYAEGVNAGLKAMATPPIEYWVLGVEPAPWKPEDCVLVLFSMFLDLQGNDFEDESTYGVLKDLLPEGMFAFLTPRGTPEWDAPLDGQTFDVPAIPGPEVFDLRKKAAEGTDESVSFEPLGWFVDFKPGSNNWAVAGSRTADGRALVANDMHLGIRVPHIWYRARFEWPSKNPEAESLQHVTGVTLPGTPAVVVGSNEHVAWGFTNAEGDWMDLVVLEPDPDDDTQYLTPDGPKQFETVLETIHVRGEPDETLGIQMTIWGPVWDEDHKGQRRALRWVAHDPEAVNMGLLRMEEVTTLEEALEQANRCGSPAQNFVVADDKGRIAWTIMGRVPKRVGFEDGRVPTSWADGKHRWDGYLEPSEYPRVVDPEQGLIWTANARVVSGDAYALLGDGGLDLGARSKQIRDDLLTLDKATEKDMLAIQLDDRAVFLDRWHKLLLGLMTPEVLPLDVRYPAVRQQLENWPGRAAIDSVSYPIVRNFRRIVLSSVIDAITASCMEADPRARAAKLEMIEGPLWKIVTERPEHLLNPEFKSWDEQLLVCLNKTLDGMQQQQPVPLNQQVWGRFNTTRIQHPLSMALPAPLASSLDMPQQALPGDSADMPRIQAPTSGASERLGVSPGHEADGYYHMPCGQSGHFLSPNYRDGHQAWAEGKPTPFLPGATVHQLTLTPAS